MVSGLLAGCGGGSPAGPSGGSGGSDPKPQGLSGTWKATRAELVSVTNSSVRVDIVAQGATLLLSLDSAGSYTRTIRDPGESGDVQTGSWSASTDVLTLRPSGVTFTIQFDYALAGDTLALSGGHVEFDVNNDGRMEETILSAALARQ